MDCQTGRIYKDNERFQELIARDPGRFQQMELPPTKKQMLRQPPRITRNEPCPCGSGLKFKKCCLRDPKDMRFKEKTND